MSRRYALVATITAFVVLAFAPMDWGSHRALWNALGNAAHYPFQALVTLVVFGLLRRRGRLARYGGAAALSCAAAVGIELVQPLVSRTGSIGDATNGIIGVAAALAGICVWQELSSRSLRVVHAILSLTVFAVLLLPAWAELEAALWRGRHFPLLGDFESALELRSWQPVGVSRVSLSSTHAANGRSSLEVRSGPGRWVGVGYLGGRADWTPFTRLSYEVYNPGDSFPLTLRVDDDQDTSDYGSRFNRALPMQPGWNEVHVPIEEIRKGPKDRLLDTARITRFYLFVPEAKAPRAFYLDNVRLERDPLRVSSRRR